MVENNYVIIVSKEHKYYLWQYYTQNNEMYLEGLLSPHEKAQLTKEKIGVGTHAYKVLSHLMLQERQRSVKDNRETLVTYSVKDFERLLSEEGKTVSEQVVRNVFTQLKNIFYSTLEIGKDELSLSDLFKSDNNLYAFSHEVVKIPKNTILTQADSIKLANHYKYKNLESKISKPKLLDLLLQAFPEANEMLYQYEGITLPFVKQSSLVFPLKRDEHPIDDFVKRKDSLFEQKCYFSQSYVSEIVSLTRKEADCSYFSSVPYNKVLDSNDYLPSRLRVFIGEILEENHRLTDDEMNDKIITTLKDKNSKLGALGHEWLKKLLDVQLGLYHNSGMAVSVPIFKIKENGKTIELLANIMNANKATGEQLFHVMPAGMLELLELEKEHIDFKDILICAAKEMVEEILLPSNITLAANSKYKVIMNLFNEINRTTNVSYQSISSGILYEFLKFIFENFEHIIADIPEYQTPKNREGKFVEPLKILMDRIQNKQEGKHYLIVDALNLRPEIIIPLYLKGDLPFLHNWEYTTHVNTAYPIFSANEDIKAWIEKNKDDWCAPGIASAVLGAANYFQQ